MAGKRAPATPPTRKDPKKVRRAASPSNTANERYGYHAVSSCPRRREAQLTGPYRKLVNATASPLLKLPAELRNQIYELVLGGHFVHVEAERRKSTCNPRPFGATFLTQLEPTQVGVLIDWSRKRCLHYYLCKAPISEDEAYARSQDPSLAEQLPGEVLANYWRLGDPFHIDSCKRRHDDCCPQHEDDEKPDWMFTPRDQVKRDKAIGINLYNTLNLSLLGVCSQIYQEAKDIPFAKNTYGFTDAFALMWFLSRLTAAQSVCVRSLWMYWRAGSSSHVSDGKRWSNWLFAPTLVDRLLGLRVLHLSVAIVHDLMGDRGPVRDDYHEGTLLNWFVGLRPISKLPLEHVTVIVSDDPASKFGIDGYTDRYHRIGWQSSHENWLELRDEQCFSAPEKRHWAEQLRAHLLQETTTVEQSA